MQENSPTRWRLGAAAGIAAAALAAALVVAMTGFAPTRAAEPERAGEPLCCGVPLQGEVTADHVFGRWVVMRAAIDSPLRTGDRIEFRADGTVTIGLRACRYAVLRAELTLSCAEDTETGAAPANVRGEVRIDDNKLLWRLDAKSTVHIAPAD